MSPMYRAWKQAKEQAPGHLILFRVRDFYVCFGEDAELAAEALALTLTSRKLADGSRLAMCGVPSHAVDRYARKLRELGHRVVVCEQTT